MRFPYDTNATQYSEILSIGRFQRCPTYFNATGNMSELALTQDSRKESLENVDTEGWLQ